MGRARSRVDRIIEECGLRMPRVAHVGRGWPWATKVGRRVKVTGSGSISVAPRVRINEDVWIHVEPGGTLLIGPGVAIGRNTVISCAGRIEIGNDVLIGPSVLIMDGSHGAPNVETAYIRQKVRVRGPISIGGGSWLGMGSRVVSSSQPVVVGDHVLVGANAVVSRSVPSGSVVRPAPSETTVR